MWSTVRALLPRHAEYLETIAANAGEARDAAEAAARRGAGLLVAIGGDGTLNEALNGLMMAPETQRPALAFVPGGTANILARALGLPRRLADVGRMLQQDARRRIDVGKVNGRYFLTIAGVGFDAEVVSAARPLRRWIGSKPAHAAAIVAALATFRPATVRLRLDGHERIVPLTFLAAANTEWYGGGLHLAPGATPDDGMFLAVYGVGLTRLQTVDVLIRTFSGRHLQHPRVMHESATRVTVDGDRPFALHADGEWLGRPSSVTFEIIPRALHIVAPGPEMPKNGRRA